MNRLTITHTPINGLLLIDRNDIRDSRGYLKRVFCANELGDKVWSGQIQQINQTKTQGKGTVRGMHFQLPPFAEMKMVTCQKGSIWDVAVDLRENSPTFLHWHAEVLSEDNGRSLLIPEGFAHGFQTLVDEAELLYLHNAFYNKEYEGGLNPLDRKLAIDWPLPISLLSDKDKTHPWLDNNFKGHSG